MHKGCRNAVLMSPPNSAQGDHPLPAATGGKTRTMVMLLLLIAAGKCDGVTIGGRVYVNLGTKTFFDCVDACSAQNATMPCITTVQQNGNLVRAFNTGPFWTGTYQTPGTLDHHLGWDNHVAAGCVNQYTASRYTDDFGDEPCVRQEACMMVNYEDDGDTWHDVGCADDWGVNCICEDGGTVSPTYAAMHKGGLKSESGDWGDKYKGPNCSYAWEFEWVRFIGPSVGGICAILWCIGGLVVWQKNLARRRAFAAGRGPAPPGMMMSASGSVQPASQVGVGVPLRGPQPHTDGVDGRRPMATATAVAMPVTATGVAMPMAAATAVA